MSKPLIVLLSRLLLVFVTLMIFTGCRPATTTGLAELAATCPQNAKLSSYLAIDASGSRTAATLNPVDTEIIRQVTTRTATCAGRLKVVLFGANAATTKTLIETDLIPAGSTEQSKYRRIPALVDETVTAVTEAATRARVDASGTDVLAQYGLANEWATQLTASSTGAPVQLNLVISTDGIQNSGAQLTPSTLTKASTTAQTENTTVPNLSGAHVSVTGIGRSLGPGESTEFTDAMKAFYTALCTKSQAAQCTVATDFTQAGK